MQVAIFGSGYVGLVTGACLADVGHQVTCVDVDAERVALLRDGGVPIYEPGLAELIGRNRRDGRIEFTTDAAAAIAASEILFVAVGTPPDEDGSADLSHVLAVATVIGRHMEGFRLVVNKSTVPVGTADAVRARIAEELRLRGVSYPFDVCSNPEFLKEGNAIEDFTRASRIVVGTGSEVAWQKIRECYAPYNRNRDKMIRMDVRSAELTKYAANAMLATKISFMNEMANLAERLGADIESVRQGIGSDPRIGFHFIYPGCGYGGSCFSKDVRAIARSAHSVGVVPRLLEAVDAVNVRQKEQLFEKLETALGGDARGRTIAVWGLSFKPDTDDLRDAPSRVLIDAVFAAGGRVRAYDPQGMKEMARVYGPRPDLAFTGSREEAVEGAEALVICTEWKQFRVVDPDWLRARLSSGVVVDGRNLYDPDVMRAAGLRYFAIGRGESVVALTDSGDAAPARPA